MLTDQSPAAAIARDLVNRVEQVVLEAESSSVPLEVDPARQRLFELFVMADAAGFLSPETQHDLSSEGLAKQLAERWGLTAALKGGSVSPTQLPPRQFRRFQLLWSLMRMWMEWGYAWERWQEFHTHPATSDKHRSTGEGSNGTHSGNPK